jgi:hypothetical protein
MRRDRVNVNTPAEINKDFEKAMHYHAYCEESSLLGCGTV